MKTSLDVLLQFGFCLVTQSKIRKLFPLYLTIFISIPSLNNAGFVVPDSIQFNLLQWYVWLSQFSVSVLGRLHFWRHGRASWPSAGQQLDSGQARQQTLLGKAAGARLRLYLAVQGHYCPIPWVFIIPPNMAKSKKKLVWTLLSLSALLSATSWVCCSQ